MSAKPGSRIKEVKSHLNRQGHRAGWNLLDDSSLMVKGLETEVCGSRAAYTLQAGFKDLIFLRGMKKA